MTAQPGAGKTTRLPPALLQSFEDHLTVVVQPRRIAARMAAEYLIGLHPSIAARIGYEFRFESTRTKSTRLLFTTDGMFLRQLMGGKYRGEKLILVLDEFHERRIAGDLLLALGYRAQKETEKAWKVIVMSATLQADTIMARFGDLPILEIPGRTYPVELDYLSVRLLKEKLERNLLVALKKNYQDGEMGSALVFLPGVGEINRAMKDCAPWAKEKGFSLFALHGNLSPDEQRRAVKEGSRPRVVFATNVAETSLTVEGITTVIDSGLERRATFEDDVGILGLELAPISQASAIQRAGRAGRTMAGQCYRLFTENDFKLRQEQTRPEIVHADLLNYELMLAVHGLSLGSIPLLTSPRESALLRAQAVLELLGATQDDVATPLGCELAALPMQPRVAKFFHEGKDLLPSEIHLPLTVLLSQSEWFRDRPPVDHREDCDLLLRVEHLVGKREAWQPPWAHMFRRVLKQYRKFLPKQIGFPSEDWTEVYKRVLIRAFPDRLAKRVKANSKEWLLVGGSRCIEGPSTCVSSDGEWGVVVSLRRAHRGMKTIPEISALSLVERDWVFEERLDFMEESIELIWNDNLFRVEQIESIKLGAINFETNKTIPRPSKEAATVLVRELKRSGLAKLKWVGLIEVFRARVESALKEVPWGSGIEFEEWLHDCLLELGEHHGGYRELESLDFQSALKGRLGWELAQELDYLAPRTLHLSNNKKFSVHYEIGRAPWVRGYIQDFFGLDSLPTHIGKREGLTVELLAPNKRPVQVTADLGGFWQNHYPNLVKGLSRRYPRHYWPDEPMTANPLLLKRYLHKP